MWMSMSRTSSMVMVCMVTMRMGMFATYSKRESYVCTQYNIFLGKRNIIWQKLGTVKLGKDKISSITKKGKNKMEIERINSIKNTARLSSLSAH